MAWAWEIHLSPESSSPQTEFYGVLLRRDMECFFKSIAESRVFGADKATHFEEN